MPPIMIPDEPAHNIENKGERLVYQKLKDQLPDGWAVRYNYVYQISVDEKKRDSEIDFIVIAPNLGLLILEVKSSYGFDCKDGIWYRLTKNGDRKVAGNPFDQAIKAKHNIINWLIEKEFRCKKQEFPCVYGHAVIYPCANTIGRLPQSIDPADLYTARDMDNLMPRIMKSFELINQPERARMFFGNNFNRVVEFFKDNSRCIIVPATEDDADDIVVDALTRQQYDAFNAISRNNRVLCQGVAGSGKTLIAYWSAIDYADAHPDEKVLYLCYNRLLAESLKKRFNNRYENLLITNFHSLCYDYCRDAHLPINNEDIAGSLDNAIDIMGDTSRFGAIFVDEGQDFESDWWIPIENLLMSEQHSRWYIFGDNDQCLYNNEMAYPYQNFVTIDLNINCRNTKNIVAFSGSVINREISHFINSPEGTKPTILPFDPSTEGRKTRVRSEIRNAVGAGYAPNQIVLLSPWGYENVENCSLNGLVREGNIAICHTNNKNITSLQDWLNNHCILSTTQKAFKGLEADYVILTDVPQLGTFAWKIADMYVACTRAKHKLVIIPSSEIAESETRKILFKQSK